MIDFFDSDSNWRQAFEVCGAPTPVLPDKDMDTTHICIDSVKSVIAWADGEHDEEHWLGIFRLDDGRFISLNSWCDYSGWDCQSGGEMFIARSLLNLIKFGLSTEERRRVLKTCNNLELIQLVSEVDELSALSAEELKTLLGADDNGQND